MSNNTPDYDNLAFDPSALNPCNEGKRGSDVLMATLEKCQAIVGKNVELEKENKRLKGWLEFIATMQWGELKDCQKYARQALSGADELKIKE